MAVSYGSSMVMNGLLIYLDAANARSYPGSGTSWFDISGNSKTGTLSGSPVYSTTNQGAFTFSGTELVLVGAITSNLTTSITYSIWFRPTSIGVARTLFWDDDGQSNGDSWVQITTDGKIETQRVTDGFGVLTCNTTLLTGSWYNLVLATSATGKTVYLNGVVDGEDQTPIASRAGKSYVSLAASTPFPPTPSGGQFIGSISSFSIYSRTLSASEVIRNFNASRGRYGI
jgi:hypothetical protein